MKSSVCMFLLRFFSSPSYLRHSLARRKACGHLCSASAFPRGPSICRARYLGKGPLLPLYHQGYSGAGAGAEQAAAGTLRGDALPWRRKKRRRRVPSLARADAGGITGCSPRLWDLIPHPGCNFAQLEPLALLQSGARGPCWAQCQCCVRPRCHHPGSWHREEGKYLEKGRACLGRRFRRSRLGLIWRNVLVELVADRAVCLFHTCMATCYELFVQFQML